MTNNVGFWISVVCLIVGSTIVGSLYMDRALSPVCQEQDLAAIQSAYAQCMTNWSGSSTACADKAERLACRRWSR